MASFLLPSGNLNNTAVSASLRTLTDTKLDHQTAIDTMFVLFSGFMVFLMQTGFAMLTAGSVRTKNVKNVLIKNLLDACVGALAYYLFGYSLAYGPKGGRFIGWGDFVLSRGDLTTWFFQWAFAATAATIVSGSVAERTSFYAYLAYAFFLTGFVYPVVSHWVWDERGFLKTWWGGMIDFAGCSVVHMVGGFAGLTGAVIVGPRTGRFVDGLVAPMPGHSATLSTLGTFILWFGWYGFNPGSALGITGNLFKTVERCAVTTTLAAASGGVTTLIVRKFINQIFDLLSVLNGVLAGLVAITASCAFVETYAAVIIGAIGALAYIGAAETLLKLKIDDPLEAFPIHGVAGFWGVLAGALFNRRDLQKLAGFTNEIGGLFYGGSRPWNLLIVNLLGSLLIAAWTVLLTGTLFFVLKQLKLLRISSDEEFMGNDSSKHGGSAYAFADRPIDEESR